MMQAVTVIVISSWDLWSPGHRKNVIPSHERTWIQIDLFNHSAMEQYLSTTELSAYYNVCKVSDKHYQMIFHKVLWESGVLQYPKLTK